MEECRARGRKYFVLALTGHAEPDRFPAPPDAWIRLGQAARGFRLLHDAQVTDLIVIGGVRRPSLWELWPDFRTFKFMMKIGKNYFGDDSLLSAIVRELEQDGFRIVPPEVLLDDMLAEARAYGEVQPDGVAEGDIQMGIDAARNIGLRDIGQASIVQQGRLLGVEDQQGTDALIRRCVGARLEGPGGVLVKVSKPGQERRIDLPTIGVATVEAAAAAGLSGIAVEAGGALIVDAEGVARAADRLGIFIVGVSVGDTVDAPVGDVRAMTDAPNPPLVFLIAGEPSGDAIGARLMVALRNHHGADIRFAGLGGDAMISEGLNSLFPISDISIMGLLEILPRLSLVLRRIRETVALIRELKPDIVVTIDSPGFCFRVWRRLGAAAPPLMHYVAPTVWAWRPERAQKFADAVQHLLALLPFEPPYFEKVGLPCTFVGHPVLESGADQGDGAAFRARHGIAADARVMGVLPGSRRGEVSRLMDPFGATVRQLTEIHPGLRIVVPTVPSVADLVQSKVADWPGEVIIAPEMDQKYDAMAACDVALAASGTVALELGMAGVPMVIGYRLNALTGLVVRRLVKAKYVCLINLLLDREAVPELLLAECREERITPAIDRLLRDPQARANQIAASARAIARLDAGGAVPSDRAAQAVLEMIFKKETSNV